jgi:hypothetical protein
LALGGGGATLALAVVVIANLSDAGSQGLALVFAPAELPVRPVATVKIPPPQNVAETMRLAAQVRARSADRDQLNTPIAALEHELDDLTGSIKWLADIPVPAANAAKPAGPPIPDAAVPALGRENAPWPPTRIATAEPAKPEFGIALAGASCVEVARLQWAAVKANFGPLLAGLGPRTLSESRAAVTHYRRVAGPLPTYTAAARLCAHMIAAHATCQPVKFTGAPL